MSAYIFTIHKPCYCSAAHVLLAGWVYAKPEDPAGGLTEAGVTTGHLSMLTGQSFAHQSELEAASYARKAMCAASYA
jgi:hypothetical protein